MTETINTNTHCYYCTFQLYLKSWSPLHIETRAPFSFLDYTVPSSGKGVIQATHTEHPQGWATLLSPIKEKTTFCNVSKCCLCTSNLHTYFWYTPSKIRVHIFTKEADIIILKLKISARCVVFHWGWSCFAYNFYFPWTRRLIFPLPFLHWVCIWVWNIRDEQLYWSFLSSYFKK